MKRLVLTLAIYLGCVGILGAQNVWKPLNCNTYCLGADSEGNLFAMAGYGGLIRSQDEGNTWTQVNDYYMQMFMAFSPNGRLFIFPSDHAFIFYSDDHGDTWQQTASHSMLNYYMSGAYAVNNDTLLLWGENHLCYTLDAGSTWQNADMSFLGDEYHTIGDVIANEAGDVYASKWYYSGVDSGIFHSTLSDMQNWELAAFDGAVVLHMEFDPEGNVVAGSYWGGMGGFQHEPGFYLLQGNQFAIADNGIVYSLHGVSNDYHLYRVLNYSGDHGETFYDYGEALPIQQNAPGGEDDGYLWKGNDGHLYFYGHGDYKKSVFNINDIHYIEGEVVVLPSAFAFGNYPYPAGQAIRVDEDHIYPVTVDGFRPDPTDLSRLIVRYDTIPMGTTIGAFGTIREMHDYVGDSQNVLDIQQTTAHHNDAITAMLSTSEEDDLVVITLTKAPYTTYYLTINGEQQTWPLVFNGVTYEGYDLRTFIGHCGIMLNQYANQFNGMELVDIQPFREYTFQLDSGTLTTDYWDPPCLSCPCEEDENQHFLTYLYGDFSFPSPFYLMHKDQLYRDSFINNDIFREGMHVDIKGIHHIRYDMPGDEVNVVELVEMDTQEETTLTGTVALVPMPYNSYIPIPGLILAFQSNGRNYYLENEQGVSNEGEYFVVGNDTIYEGQEITATFTSKLMIDNGLDFYYLIHINEAEILDEIFPPGSEWYYEIQNENGSITYQYLYQAGDTIVQDEPTHILVRINTLYDKGLRDEVTHEYVYVHEGKVYWWNKTLEEFTVLYDFGAQEGDTWVTKVGTESLIMHVNAVEYIEYEGISYRVLHVSDPNDLFSGDIVCGIGHLTSFFPERLMGNGDGVHVEGLRCYWVEDELVFNPDGEDCDAIYEELHGLEEDGPSTGLGAFTVYPNPTNGILFVQTLRATSLPDQTYRITNIMGQTILSGNITDETQQIDVSGLPQGMYFITFAGETRKFVMR